MENTKELLEKIEKLEKEKTFLQNRCHTLSKGLLCVFCSMECEHRTVNFQDPDKIKEIEEELDKEENEEE